MSNFFKHIQYERLPETKCLGCSKFFFHSHNFFDPSITRTPLIDYPSVLELQNISVKQKLLQDICSLINSDGGVIMFNVKRENRSILPIGI